MPTVRLAFTSAPRYVRTARLVGAAVARRAGVTDAVLDEVRLAIGEACGRAVARHRRHGIAELIRVELCDDGPYTVRVIDASPAVDPPVDAPDPAGDDEDADRMGETLLTALVHDLQVRTGSEGTEVRMTWPVRRRTVGARV